MSDCVKNEVYPSKLAKMSEFRHIFSRATLWVDIANNFLLPVGGERASPSPRFLLPWGCRNHGEGDPGALPGHIGRM